MLDLTAKDARLLKAASGRLAVWAKRAISEHFDCCVIKDRTMTRLDLALDQYEALIDDLRRRASAKDTRWRVRQ